MNETSSFLSSLKEMDGILGIAVLFKDGNLFSASGTLLNNMPLYAICSRIIENPEMHTIHFDNKAYHVIQRDISHILSLSSRVGRQYCLSVYILPFGYLITHFYWNPPSISESILRQIEKEVSLSFPVN